MGSSALHFTIGWIIGILFTLHAIIRGWRQGTPLFDPLLHTGITATSVGVWAMLPSLLVHLGLAEKWVHHPVMNLFCGYAWIAGHAPHSSLIGIALISMALGTTYVLLLCVLVHVRRTAIPRQ